MREKYICIPRPLGKLFLSCSDRDRDGIANLDIDGKG